MKTYVLIISQQFPQTHKRKGENTDFSGQILEGNKIHTIRSNYDLWAKRIAMINKGEAVLSVRHWSGKPYRSPQVEFAEFTSVGIEQMVFREGRMLPSVISDKYIIVPNAFKIANNDGLSFEDFAEWFKGYDLTKHMAIIHFTDFRYLDNGNTPNATP